MSNSYPGTQAVLRAIRLLKLFGNGRASWTLNELVEQAELNKTTTFRLLSALESEGLIERTESNGYRLGPEMVALGGRAIQQNGLLQVSEPILNELMSQVNERVTLEQPILNADGTHSMLLLIQVHSKHLIGINQLYGTRLPLYATSTGKAYLAYLDDDEREQILGNRMTAYTEQTITRKAALEKELKEIRERGYAVALGELEAGLMAIGAAVFDHTGRPTAAISIEAPDSRIDEEKLHAMAEVLLPAAAQISDRLGYRPMI